MGRPVAVALVAVGSLLLIATASIELARLGVVWLGCAGAVLLAVGLLAINVDDNRT